MHHHRRLRLRQQLPRLVAFEIGEEAEAATVARVEQHHAHIGQAIGVHHLMLEVTDIDMVLQCHERVQDAGITITSTLGRHANDRMLSFYMRSPFGFEVEIGYDGCLVDESWSANQFVEGDLWGHRGLDPETIAKNLASMPQAAE